VATLTDEQWAAAQSWIGNEPRDSFQNRYSRLGILDDAIRESLRVQLNSLIFGIAVSFTVEDISMNFSENVKAIERRLAEFNSSGGAEGGGAGGTIFSKIKRPTWR
jgi:hypothetical protein